MATAADATASAGRHPRSFTAGDARAAPAPRVQSLDEALEQLTFKCSNWDKVDKCGPGRFATTMATELPVFEANRLRGRAAVAGRSRGGA